MEHLIEYYKLCAVKSANKQPIAVVNMIKPATLNVIFTQRQITLYLKECGTRKCIRETVVGASKATVI